MKITILPVYNLENYKKFKIINGASPIAYILSYLEKYYPDDLIYASPDLEFLLKTNPDIVGISAPYSYLFDEVIEISRKIKACNKKIPIILGGNHITSLPKTLPQTIDIGVIGEGEETFRDLVTLYKEHGEFTAENLLKIEGLVFHSKGKKIITEKRKPIENIDSIPFSMKHFCDIPGMWIPSLVTGRGSPYLKNPYQVDNNTAKIRLHSPERMAQDLVDIITFSPQFKIIPIPDNVFFYNKDRLEKFAKIIYETGIIKHVFLSPIIRPQEFTEEICYILKNFFRTNSIQLYYISFSQKVRDEFKEPKIDIKRQREIFKLASKYNISLTGSFFLGSQIETKEDLAKSYWIMKDHMRLHKNIFFASEFLLTYPGTDSWTKGIMKGLVNENLKDWDILNQSTLKKETPLLTPLHQRGEFSKIYEVFQKLNLSENGLEYKPFFGTREFLVHAMNELVSEVIRTYDISSILQVTDESVFDFKKVFIKNEFTVIDTMAIESFYKKKKPVENKSNKKYDCVVLLFTLDITPNPENVIKYCNEVLNENGVILISFFNGLYYHTLQRFLMNANFTDIFYIFNKLNIFTYKSMTDLIIKNDFIPKKCTPCSFYKEQEMYTPEMAQIVNIFQKVFKIDREVFATPYYIYSCRKKT